MARRPSDTDSSQRSQDDPQDRPEMPEKVKREILTRSRNHKHERDSTSTSKTREETNDSQDEEESAESTQARDNAEEENISDQEGDEGSPKGRKRARVDGDDEERTERSHPARPKTLERGEDGFVLGSIVRVKLHQFLTYDDVEFRPGPYLNMVLGPNGSGKSSIACALCLGLNWPPSVLGRANNVVSFVKSGFDESTIELELKGPNGHPNIIIKREIKVIADPNPKKAGERKAVSTWTVNGENHPARRVSEVVLALGIQVNNLCSFLPQDKVAQFAQMTSQELLVATEKAAGNTHLQKWHETLVSLGKEIKAKKSILESEKSHLNTAEERNAVLEKEVEQYRKRREIERQIELYELILPFREYQAYNERVKVLKKTKDDLEKHVHELQEKNKPVEIMKKRLEEGLAACSSERDCRKKVAQDKFKAMKSKWEENNNLDVDYDEIANELTLLKDEERKRKESIEKLTKDIHVLEDRIAHPPEVEDGEAIEKDARENTERRFKLLRSKDDLVESAKRYIDEAAKQKVEGTGVEQELKALDDISQRKLESLRQTDPDIADVVVWLRQNQNRFKMEILEPPMLSVIVPDIRYAAAVESCLNFNQQRMFVAQCQEDQTLFNELIMDSKEALGRNVIVNCWYRAPTQIPPLPLNEQEFRQLGFEKYAMDCIECPEGLRFFLQRDLGLHRIPISLNQQSVDQNRAMEAMTRGGGGNGGSFIVGHVMNRVQRSRYGRKLVQNMTTEIREAKIFASVQVDQNKKRELERRLQEAKALWAEADEEAKNISLQIKILEEQLDEVLSEKKSIDERRSAVRDALSRLEKMRLQLERKKASLNKELKAPSVEQKRQDLLKKIFEIAKKRMSIAKQIQKLIRGTIEETTNATKAGLRFYQVTSNKAALEELVRARNAEYDEIRGQYETAVQEYKALRDVAKRKLALAREKHKNVDDELRATFQTLTESGEIATRSAEEYGDLIENLRAQLELNLVTNAGVIEQYERRQKEIEEARKKVSELEDFLAILEKRSRKTRDKWYPALSELVSEIGRKFTRAFDSVKCAGEIRLVEHEDYDKWTIDILVSFRDSDRMQLLTGQRQSGGERALTTIMYLMSLVENARAPFSLVDEINQGMDAQYERAVHNALVTATCRPESGQYFLITPKLLTDLEYHERMKVLCVCSGEWLPEDNYSGNMNKMLDRYLAKQRPQSASSH